MKGWTVVVAGTYREFEQWCLDNKVNLKRLHEYRVCYASDASILKGRPVARVVYTGHWHVRDLDLLEAALAAERASVAVVRY